MIQEVEITKLIPEPRSANEWDPETQEKLLRNIERSGFYPPLVVMPHPEQVGSYRILDGHLRLACLQALKKKKVRCVVCHPKDETEVELLLATLNRLRGTDNLKKRAQLIDSLTQAIPMADLILLIPETQNQIQDLMAMAKLQFEELEKSVLQQATEEAKCLPVPFHFMVPAAEAPVVEAVLSQVLSKQKLKKKEQGKALAFICRQMMEKGGLAHE